MASTSTSTSTTTESTPLIHKKAVTFNPNPSVMGADGTTSRQPISALPNSPQLQPPKPKRRNSYGAPLTLPNIPASKIGPQRTTKNAQKLKILPNPDFGDDGPDEESGRDVYSQYTRIKDPTARRDAARLGKADRDTLPRVTAYCTANTYRMDPLELFLKSKRSKARGAKPKQIDECIYTPYNYGRPTSERALEVQSMPVSLGERRHSDSAIEDTINHPREDLIDLHTQGGDTSLSNGLEDAPRMHPDIISTHISNAAVLSNNIDFDTQVHTPEVFVFDYGVVVIWGMTLEQERRFLEDIQRYAVDKLPKDDREEECFNFYYTREYQARIYNDFITLRDKSNYMTKLAISHALAQSVKVLSLPLLPLFSLSRLSYLCYGRLHSSKQWSIPPSRKTKTSPKKSPRQAPYPTHAQKLTNKSASSSTYASTSISTGLFSTPRNYFGSNLNSSLCTRL